MTIVTKKALISTMSRASIQSPPSKASPAPAEFADNVVWAAWLYYNDELTQAEIAARLHVSRATVVNYLQEARRLGIVTIRLDPQLVGRTELANMLCERFDLEAATVFPSIEEQPSHRTVGRAGARVLSTLLEPGDRLGVAWGRTILSAARAVEYNGIGDLTIVQLAGSSSSTQDFAPELCTSLMANALQARCANLHAPAVVTSKEVRDLFLKEPALVRQFELIHSVNKVVYGVGDLEADSTFADSQLMSSDRLEAIRREGRAIGVLLGQFIGPDGEPVQGPIDDRLIGLKVEELSKIPQRICLAGGARKYPAIRAVLRGRLATHLVTDSDTATALLEDELA
ncbi:putative transcriptional regulator protein, AsnC/GntR family [Fulvimarina pelagi HTCC2506]|uniref:Putative transcriptional regulator protein, AsnC/GntR family n=2 Tax=Fulvimarina pelagi TaxID=217511 RepID=Q0FXF7_9HYPH|nr:putative transcriptional regulator protein, AsnC/GntR family [Fulvimarina pelagi HTCC2506]